MAGSIERVLSPEEQELQRYLDEIDLLKSQVATQLADLESYKAELARFSAEYHAVLGPLFTELDRLELEIEEYRTRIRLLETYPELDPAKTEEEVEKLFRSQRERLDQERARNDAYENAWKQEEAKPELDEADAVEIKRIYRDLAKKHHPDFAIDEQDRLEREASMQKINAAFADRDMSSLRSMKESLRDHLAAFEKLSIGEKLVWAIREVSRLRTQLDTLKNDKLVLVESTTGKSYHIHFHERDVIAPVKSDLQDQIGTLKRILASYQAELESLRIKRSTT